MYGYEYLVNNTTVGSGDQRPTHPQSESEGTESTYQLSAA
jgi:hypothetical protein